MKLVLFLLALVGVLELVRAREVLVQSTESTEIVEQKRPFNKGIVKCIRTAVADLLRCIPMKPGVEGFNPVKCVKKAIKKFLRCILKFSDNGGMSTPEPSSSEYELEDSSEEMVTNPNLLVEETPHDDKQGGVVCIADTVMVFITCVVYSDKETHAEYETEIVGANSAIDKCVIASVKNLVICLQM